MNKKSNRFFWRKKKKPKKSDPIKYNAGSFAEWWQSNKSSFSKECDVCGLNRDDPDCICLVYGWQKCASCGSVVTKTKTRDGNVIFCEGRQRNFQLLVKDTLFLESMPIHTCDDDWGVLI